MHGLTQLGKTSAQWFKEMMEHIVEIWAIKAREEQYNRWLCERLEQCDLEAADMIEAIQVQEDAPPPPQANHANNLTPTPWSSIPTISEMTPTDMIFEKLNNHKPEKLDDDKFIQCIRDGYVSDKLLSLIAQKRQDYQSFTLKDNLIWKKNIQGDDALCLSQDQDMILEILAQAHEIVGHFGSQRTNKYICEWYW